MMPNNVLKALLILKDNLGHLSFSGSAPDFTSSLPKKQIGREGTSEVKLSVVVKGDQTPLVTWYRNDGLADTTIFTVTSGVVGTNVQNETIVQSNLTINHPNRTSNSVFLAKAAYGTFSPVSNTSTVLDVWCEYEHHFNFSNCCSADKLLPLHRIPTSPCLLSF